MSSMNISHFLLCPIPPWGKNYLSFIAMPFQEYSLVMSNRTYQAFLYSCDAIRPRTGNHYNNPNSSSARTRQNKNRGITSVSRRAFGTLESSSTNQVNAWRCAPFTLAYLSASNLKDPLAIQLLDWHRSGSYAETIRRCIPCCIPDSLRGEANYMFCNGYIV